MNRRRRNEDPAYLQAMREAKELFDAEMAKAAMKRKGRPPKVAKTAPVVEDDDIDDVLDDVEEAPPPPPPAKKKAAKKK
jgi:hypothetical protein